jgi:hypothetical protein
LRALGRFYKFKVPGEARQGLKRDPQDGCSQKDFAVLHINNMQTAIVASAGNLELLWEAPYFLFQIGKQRVF